MRSRQITALLLSMVMTISACIPTGIQAYAAEDAGAGATEAAAEMTAPEEESGEAGSSQTAVDESSQNAEDDGEQNTEELQKDEDEKAEEPADDKQEESAVSESSAEEDAEAETESVEETADQDQEEASDEESASVQDDASEQEEAEQDPSVTEQPAPQEEEAVTEENTESEDAASSSDPETEEKTDEAVETTEGMDAMEAGGSAGFDSAVPLTVGEPVDVDVTEEEPNAYFSFTPEETGTYRFYSTGDYDTYVTLYNSNFNEVSNDDQGAGESNDFSLSQTLFEGSTYYYEAREYSRSYASFTVCLEQVDTEVPEFYVEGNGSNRDISCNPGESVSLSVTAHSTSELTYSWQDEGGNELGCYTDTYVYVPDHRDYIICFVSDNAGNSASVSFNITVDNNLQVYPEGNEPDNHSYNVAASPGDTALLKVSVDALEQDGLTYNWYDTDRNEIPGAVGAEYETPEITGRATYYCSVVDKYGNTGEAAFYIYIENHFRAYPQGNDPDDYPSCSMSVSPGADASLQVAVEADDRSMLTYQWYGDYVEIAGANSAEYNVSSITGAHFYYCEVNDGYGNSATVYFSVNVDTHFSVRPIGADEDNGNEAFVYILPNEEVTLQVEATSDDPDKITYQWYSEKSGKYIEGETSASYTTKPAGQETYHCYVSDGYGGSTDIVFYVSIQNNLVVQPVHEDGSEEDYYYDSAAYLHVLPNEVRTLSVEVSADDPDGITYEWHNINTGMIIDGATGSSYSTGPITDATDYYCVVRDRYGNSREVSFYITVQNNFYAYAVVDGEDEGYDANLGVSYNESTTLQVGVTANDTSKVTYRWSVDGEPLEDKTTESLTTDPVTAAKDYECHVSDGYGNNYYINFHVYVENDLRVMIVGEEETDVSIAASPNETVSLQVEVSAVDDSQLTYRWINFDTDEEITEAEGTSYTTPPVIERTCYRFEVTDQYGNTAYAYFTVFVENNLKVYPKGDPDNDYYYYYADPNQPAVLEVIAEADDPDGLTFRWYNENTGEYSEETGATLTTPAVTKRVNYRCTVSDPYGNSKSVWFYVHPDNQLRVTPVEPAGIRPEDGGLSFEVDPGETVTLGVNVTAKDMEGITYQWTSYDPEYGSTDIEGATGDTYMTTISRATNITCNVYDKYGNQDNAWFSISVRNNLRAWPEGEEDSSEKSITLAPHDPVSMKVMVSATDMSQLTYVWEKGKIVYDEEWDDYYTDYETIEGADTDTYAIPSVTETANYNCTVSDQYNNSKTVYFEVVVDNKLSVHPVGTDDDYIDIELTPGEETTLTTVVEALDTEGITYQWYKGEELLEGLEEAVLSGINESGYYSCRVRDAYGNEKSADFNVTVQNNLQLRQEGNSGIYNGTRTIYTAPGQDVTLNVTATATVVDGLSFTWYKDGDEIEGADGVSYAASGNEGATYKCEVTDKYGSSGTVTFHVIINNRLTAYAEEAGPLQTETSLDRGTMAGRTLRVIASAADMDSIHYQWSVDNNDDLYDPLSGENTESYTVTQSDLDRGIVHARCDVTDDYGNSCCVDYYFYSGSGSEEDTFSVYPEGAEQYEDGSHESDVGIYPDAGQETVTLKVIVEGEDQSNLHYQWYDSNSDEEIDIDRDTIEVPNENGYYRCEVRSIKGFHGTAFFYVHTRWLKAYVYGEKDNSATVTLSPAQAYTLKVTAEGSNTDNLTYTWYRDDNVIENEITDSLDITAQKSEEYMCEVQDQEGNSSYVYFYIEVGTLTAACANTEAELWDEWGNAKEYRIDAVPGGTLTLQTTAESSLNSTITYSWYDRYNTKEILATGSTYLLPLDKARRLACRAEDQYGNTFRIYYDIYVNHFKIEESDEETHYNPNTSEGCTLKVNVSGDDLDGMMYTWTGVDNTTVAEGTDSITVNPGADSWYSCKVEDKYGNYRDTSFNVIVVSGLTAVPADLSIGTYNAEDNLLTIAAKEEDALTLRTEASNDGETGLNYIWRSHSLADPEADMKTGWTRVGGNSDSLEITAEEDTRFECCVEDQYGAKVCVTFDVFTSEAKTIDRTVITLDEDSYTYDGTQKKPGVRVQYQNADLTEGTDYTVSYGANINAGEGTVTITGKGDFEGSAVKTFAIEKAGQVLKANKDQITLEAGSTDTISVTGAKTAVSFTSSDEAVATVDANGKVTAVSKGTAVIRAEAAGTNNYESDSVSVEVTVTPEIVDISRATITIEDTAYTGSVIVPPVTAVYGGETLIKGTDYTLTYGQNTEVGTYTVKVNGIGAYKGSVDKTYKIVQAEQILSANAIALNPYKEAKVSVTGAQGALSYKSSKTSVATVSEDGTVTAVAQGEATITVTAAATTNYKAGSTELTVTVTAYDLASADCMASLDAAENVYDGEEKKPAVTVEFGEMTLEEGTDYTVSYENNIHAGTASAIITGNNKVTTGTTALTFNIQKAAQVITATDLIIVAGESKKIDVEGAQGTVTYVSSDPAAAAVNEEGNVTAAADAAGKTAAITVNAGATDDYNAAEAITVNVKVVANQEQLDQEAAANVVSLIQAATGGSFADAAAAKAAADAAETAYNALTSHQKALVQTETDQKAEELIAEAQAAAAAAAVIEAAAGTFDTAAEAKAAADAAKDAYDALSDDQKALIANITTAQNAAADIADAQAAANAAVAIKAATGTFGTAAEAQAAAAAAKEAYDALTPEQKALISSMVPSIADPGKAIADAQAAANAAAAIETAAGTFGTAAEAQAAADAANEAYNALTPEQKALVSSMVPSIADPEKAITDAQTAAGKQKTAEEAAAKKAAEEAAAKKAAEEAAARKAAEEAAAKKAAEEAAAKKAAEAAAAKKAAEEAADRTAYGPAKGKTIKKGNFKYKVSKQGKRAVNGAAAIQGTVTITGFVKASKKKSATSVNIPATITVDGITYKVTEIGAKAFKGMAKLKTVTIGANVTKIGKNAFQSSKKLKTVKIKTKTLKSIGANAFKGIKAKASFKLNVKGTKKAKAALIKKYKKLVKKGKAPSGVTLK